MGGQRLQDIETEDNFNPIHGLEKVDLMTAEEALAYAAQNDSEVQPLARHMALSYAYMHADNLLVAHSLPHTSISGGVATSTGAVPPIQVSPEPLNREEMAAIHVYTQDFPLHAILNARLRDRDRKKLKPFFPFLKLLLTAFYKLPNAAAGSLIIYRGILGNYSTQHAKMRAKGWGRQ